LGDSTELSRRCQIRISSSRCRSGERRSSARRSRGRRARSRTSWNTRSTPTVECCWPTSRRSSTTFAR
jgi:hypothetical protein